MSVITRLSFQSWGGLWKGIKENDHGDERFDKKFQWWPPAIIVHTAATATAAKWLQSCPTLCDPIDGSPPGSSVPGILQARTLEWVAISFFSAWKWKVKVKSLSRFRLFTTPWSATYQAPRSMAFSRQEYSSGVPLPSPLVHTTIYQRDN